MAVLVYLVKFTITGLVGVSVTPTGAVHTVFTFTETSTAGLSSTVQVRVGEDPATIVSPEAGITVKSERVAETEGRKAQSWRCVLLYASNGCNYPGYRAQHIMKTKYPQGRSKLVISLARKNSG